MMKLYYTKGACSLAVRILIHELGLTSEYESVDLKAKKTETGADFLKINPKGAVPTLQLDNNEILTENAAIQIYLAEQNKGTNLLPAIGDFKRYRILEWIIFITTDLHKNFGPLFNQAISQDLKDTIFIPIIKNKMKYVNDQLAQKKFLMGDDFTLPDCYLFVMLLWLHHFRIDVNEWPNLKNYFAEVKKRKSIQEALKEEGLNLG